MRNARVGLLAAESVIDSFGCGGGAAGRQVIGRTNVGGLFSGCNSGELGGARMPSVRVYTPKMFVNSCNDIYLLQVN